MWPRPGRIVKVLPAISPFNRLRPSSPGRRASFTPMICKGLSAVIIRCRRLLTGFIGLVLSAGLAFSAAALAGVIDRQYGPVQGEPFPVPALNVSKLNPVYLRTVVWLDTAEAPGTIIIDPAHHFLYLVQEGGRAIRYGVGVGRQGFAWSGTATIRDKQEWPDWYPPREMIERKPELLRQVG